MARPVKFTHWMELGLELEMLAALDRWRGKEPRTEAIRRMIANTLDQSSALEPIDD